MSDVIDSVAIANEWLEKINNQSNFIPLDGNKIRFNTPFVDPFGDQISLLITSNHNSTYTVSDQGYTIWNIESRGTNLTKNGSVRLKLIQSILNTNRASLGSNYDIYKTTASRQEVAQIINDILDSVIKISDLAFGSRNNARGMFKDDVLDYITENNKQFSFDIGFSVKGKSNLAYDLDFVFHQKIKDTKWTKLYTSLNKNVSEMVMGIWLDTELYRQNNPGNDISFNVLVKGLDDRSVQFKDSLIQHNINVVSFDDKDDFKSNFAIA
ncbi:DUF1828 domain-containing protein [Companilactobacillus nantensis]|nr:DUF1828 domain-containing protein [Companilactobacillus nantensis]GEO63000.1 hypothetical protein LNA01_01830 [Companilactobacillus nantensis]